MVTGPDGKMTRFEFDPKTFGFGSVKKKRIGNVQISQNLESLPKKANAGFLIPEDS